MFEPLLGLLTRGYVESKCDNRPISGWSGPAAMSGREVMGLRSNPFGGVGEVVRSWRRPEWGSGCRGSSSGQDLRASLASALAKIAWPLSNPLGRWKSVRIVVPSGPSTSNYGSKMDSADPLPMPDDPVLAQYAKAFNDAGHWCIVFDSDWRFVYMSDELLEVIPESLGTLGEDMWGPRPETENPHFGRSRADLQREQFRNCFSDVLMTVPGGREELRARVAPNLVDLVDELSVEPPALVHSNVRTVMGWGADLAQWWTTMQIRDVDGRLAGFIWLQKPMAGMSAINMVSGGVDTRHVDQIYSLTNPDRRPAAVLFADLEGSSHLSRRLSTLEYFDLARRLVRAADVSVVQAGGVVGRHLGDGVTAFFLAEALGSESAAARACIEASRSLRDATAAIAERSQLDPDEIVLRFGLHWGSTLYVGLFKTVARAEVTALGDEVNEAARIEACATGGRSLASKDLIERLSDADREALGIARVSYMALGELPSATEKARRDAPSISVCEI